MKGVIDKIIEYTAYAILALSALAFCILSVVAISEEEAVFFISAVSQLVVCFILSILMVGFSALIENSKSKDEIQENSIEAKENTKNDYINKNEALYEIKKYKELLDSNAISQADFDEKKKELLNLLGNKMKNYTYVEKNCKKTKLFFSIVMLVAAIMNLYIKIKYNSEYYWPFTIVPVIFYVIEILIAIILIITSVCINKSLMLINASFLNYALFVYAIASIFNYGFVFKICIPFFIMIISLFFMRLFEAKKLSNIKVIATIFSISYIVLSGFIMYFALIWSVHLLAMPAGFNVILSLAPICLISGTYKKVDLADVKAVENMNLKFSDKQNPDNIPEQIKEYKELLDMGIITEEEYEKKKTELLNKKS